MPRVYQMKAGNLKRLSMTDMPEVSLLPGEVRIDVHAIGLNFADVFSVMGLYSATPKGVFTPGLEFAGTISEVGNEVEGWKVGDQVMGATRFGAYTESLTIDHRYLLRLPPGWTFAEGASYLVQALSAYYALVVLGDLQKGQTVMIHSGAGGVGTYAQRLAKQFKAFTIGTTSSPTKVEYMLRELGYDRALVRNKAFANELDQVLEGRELNIILECIGGSILRQGLGRLAPQGRMVVYGAAQYASPTDRPNYLRLAWLYLRRPKVDPLALIPANQAILGFNLIWLYDRIDEMQRHLQDLSQFDLGKPVVGAQFDFMHLPDALRELRSGTTVGKVVVVV